MNAESLTKAAAMTVPTLETLVAELAEEERWALFREYATTVQRIEGRHLDHLLSLGNPWAFWDNTGAPGVGSIRTLAEGHFEFTKNGRSAVVLPVYDSETPAWAPLEQRFEGLLDLLAFDPARPARWSLRRGQAILLGSIYVGLVLEEGCALPLYSNPLSWLKADGEGVVILNWEVAPSLLLDVTEFVVEDVETGNRIKAALTPAVWVKEAAA